MVSSQDLNPYMYLLSYCTFILWATVSTFICALLSIQIAHVKLFYVLFYVELNDDGGGDAI